jgi:Tfp pilus assembly protein PilX
MLTTAASTIPTTPTTAAGRRRDDGSVLILTLVLSVVLSLVVIGLATFAATGLATSDVTTERNAVVASATAAVQYEIEELAHKRSEPCSDADTQIPLPGALAINDASLTLWCRPAGWFDGHPAAVLEATASNPQTSVTVSALVEVPRGKWRADVVGWSVD